MIQRPTNGLEVTDFDAVSVSGFAGQELPLDDIDGWESHDRMVRTRCGDPGTPLLAVELTMGEQPTANAPSFLLTYTSGGRTYEDVVELDTTVCHPWPCRTSSTAAG